MWNRKYKRKKKANKNITKKQFCWIKVSYIPRKTMEIIKKRFNNEKKVKIYIEITNYKTNKKTTKTIQKPYMNFLKKQFKTTTIHR